MQDTIEEYKVIGAGMTRPTSGFGSIKLIKFNETLTLRTKRITAFENYRHVSRTRAVHWLLAKEIARMYPELRKIKFCFTETQDD